MRNSKSIAAMLLGLAVFSGCQNPEDSPITEQPPAAPSRLLVEDFEKYESPAALDDVWQINTNEALSYELASSLQQNGAKSIKFVDLNNGDRANIQRNFNSTNSASVACSIYLPSFNQPDFAELQLQSINHLNGEVVTVQLTKNGSAYDVRIQQNNSQIWNTVGGSLAPDAWHTLQVAYDNTDHLFRLTVNGTDLGEHPFNKIDTIGRIELNAGGWGNTAEMNAYFDALEIQGIASPHDATFRTWHTRMATPEGTTIHGIAFLNGKIYMTGYSAQKLFTCDANGTVLDSISLDYRPTGLTADGTNLWLTSDSTGLISKITPEGSIITSIPIPNPGDSTGLFYLDNALWNTGFYQKAYRIDLAGGILKTIDTPTNNNEGLVVIDGTIYIADWSNQRIRLLNENGEQTDAIWSPVQRPLALAWDGTYLWLAGDGSKEIYTYKLD